MLAAAALCTGRRCASGAAKDLRKALRLSRVEMTAVRSNALRVGAQLCDDGAIFTPAALSPWGTPPDAAPPLPYAPDSLAAEVARQVVARTHAIDEVWRAAPAGSTVVNLGAGFDMRPHRLGLYAARGVRTVEVDLPGAAALKQERVAASPGVAYRPLSLAQRVGADAVLPEGTVVPGEHVLWCAEGVLEYLPPPRRAALLAELRRAARKRRVETSLVCTLLLPSLFDAHPPSADRRRRFGAWALPLSTEAEWRGWLAAARWDVRRFTMLTDHCAVVEARGV